MACSTFTLSIASGIATVYGRLFSRQPPLSEGKSFRIGKRLTKSELNVFLLDYTRLPGIKIPPALPALLF
jgi:hypothetical protein